MQGLRRRDIVRDYWISISPLAFWYAQIKKLRARLVPRRRSMT